MSDSIRLSSVAIDCPDAGELAAFYADITGGTVTFANDAWATVDGPGRRYPPGEPGLDSRRPAWVWRTKVALSQASGMVVAST
jgi:hypothetical protein